MVVAEIDDPGRTTISRVLIKNYRRFKDLDIKFDSGTNILVGSNEAGKTTLLEAINLALTGRVNGRWAPDEVSPYWFNLEETATYFDTYDSENPFPPPEVSIEVFLTSTDSDIIKLKGQNNSLEEDACGFRINLALDQEFRAEFLEYMSESKRTPKADGDSTEESPTVPRLLPTEFFTLTWNAFNADVKLHRKPKSLRISQVDTRTQQNPYGVDFYTRQLLVEHIEPSDSARISASIRVMSDQITSKYLGGINEALKSKPHEAPDNLGVQLDHTPANRWHNTITPVVHDVPFSMAGQAQQATTKIELAMLKASEATDIVFIEEPENHLSHTRLRKLVSRLEDLANGRQLIVTTHSSFVLNRLGLKNLKLLDGGNPAVMGALKDDDMRFFQKLPNFDTLRLVLADKIALVEGISDLLILSRAIQEITGQPPEMQGIDIISVEGTPFKRWLNLAKLLNKPTVALRDSDQQTEAHWKTQYADALGERGQLFVGDPSRGATLEPQIIDANSHKLAEITRALGLSAETDLSEWMSDSKAEAALNLAQLSEKAFDFPEYIERAVGALYNE